ncbi:MAG: hypothetical protein KKA42_02875, partial [candidate division Zixibacteria bacterium]|nr:hypothetical protein [candidate division Zixibacteria bacterium]
RTWQVESGYQRRFELADLDDIYLAGTYGWDKFSVALGLSQFGKTTLYAEQVISGSLSWRPGSISLGLRLSAMQIQLGDNYPALRAATFGLGAGFATRRFVFAVDGDNLTKPRLTEDSPLVEPRYSLYGEYVAPRGYSLTGRWTVENLQSPQFALAQYIRLSPRASIFWGVTSGPAEYSGGFEVTLPRGAAVYSLSVHPTLGLTHTVSLSWGSRKQKEDHDEFD